MEDIRIHYSIQIVFKNDNKESSSRRADSVDTVIYTRRVSRYVERKHIERSRVKKLGI